MQESCTCSEKKDLGILCLSVLSYIIFLFFSQKFGYGRNPELPSQFKYFSTVSNHKPLNLRVFSGALEKFGVV